MQMAAQPNPNHENGKTADRREERFKIHAAGNGRSSGGGVLIFGCCALVAAGIGAAFAARRARNAQRKSDQDRRIGRVEDGMGGIEIKRNLEESEGMGDSSKVRPAELSLDRGESSKANFEIRPRLEVKEFDQEKENPSIRVCKEESESSLEIKGEKGEKGSEGTGESSRESSRERVQAAELSLDRVEHSASSLEVEVFDQKEDRLTRLHEEESESSIDVEGDKGEEGSEGTGESSVELSMEQVWPEEMQHTGPEIPNHILDTAQVGDDDSIEEHLQTPHINPIEVKPMLSEEVLEHITKEDEALKQTGASVQEEIYPKEENQVQSIQSCRAFADCIQQEQILADDLEGVKEMIVPSLASREMVENSDVDTDMNTTVNKVDNDVKDAGSQVEELGLYCFNESSKILSDDENANIEQDEKTLVKSAEGDREVPVKEEDLRGEEGSKLNNEAIHPSELKNVSVSVNDKSIVALAETEYDGKTSAALDKFLHNTNPGQGELSVDNSTEIQAIETLVTQSISKNSEMVKELGAKMDNDDCVAKEFSTIGVISYMFQDQEKPGLVQDSSEQFQEEENELFTEVGRRIEGSEAIQDSAMESSTEEIFPEKEGLSSIEWKEVVQVDVPKSADDTVGIEQVKEEHGVIKETSIESSAEKELSSVDLKNREEVEASKRTDDVVSIEQVKEGDGAEDADVVQDSSTESSAEEIFPYHDKELPSNAFKNTEQIEAVKRTDEVAGIEQAKEEHKECKQKVASEVTDDSSSEIQAIETLVTQSISKNSEMIKELGAKIENDYRVAKESSTIGVISYMFQDQENPEVIQESLEHFQAEENELFIEVGRDVEGSKVIQDIAMESSEEEIFPEKEKEVLPSIESKKFEQVEVPKSTNDTVGIEQVKEEHGAIQETSMGSSAEKGSPSTDLQNFEQVEAAKRTDDKIGIEEVEEGDKAEDVDVIQDCSTASSAEEIFPDPDKELPSIDFKNIGQVEAVKRTNDAVGIEQTEEEREEHEQKVASEVADDNSSEVQAIETLVTQSISKNSEMIKGLGAKIENDDRVPKELSTIGVVSYMFQDQENPDVIQESLEQFQKEENEIFTEVGRGIEGSEAIQDSAMESSAEEIFPEKEKEELPSIESKNGEVVEVPKSTDDTVGIEQVKEEHGAIQETSMGSSAEKESPSIDLLNNEQLEASKRTDDMIRIEQIEEGDEAKDADVIEDSSTASSEADKNITDQDKELPSIDFNNIKQAKAVQRTNDVFGIEHAEEEYEECEQRVATKVDVLLMSSNYRFFIILLLALGVALGLLTFAQPDSLRCRNNSLPEMYQKLYQLFFRSYRAVVDI